MGNEREYKFDKDGMFNPSDVPEEQKIELHKLVHNITEAFNKTRRNSVIIGSATREISELLEKSNLNSIEMAVVIITLASMIEQSAHIQPPGIGDLANMLMGLSSGIKVISPNDLKSLLNCDTCDKKDICKKSDKVGSCDEETIN